MAHDHDSNEKVVYVGDSRVRQKSGKMMMPHDFSAYPGKSEVFIPNFLLKEWMVAAVFMVGMLVLVMSAPAPLGYPADPTNTSFIPMPDWYFLFMYQILKYPYTSEHYVLFGTLIFPGIGAMSLILAPFLDTGKQRRFYKRPIASLLMAITIVACSYLTWVSWHHYGEELKANHVVPEDIKREQLIKEHKINPGVAPMAAAAQQKAPKLVATDDPGYKLIQKATCIACHGTDLTGTKSIGAPSLRDIGDKLNQDQIMKVIKNGFGNGKMPAQYNNNIKKGLSDKQITQIAAWLAKQKSS